MEFFQFSFRAVHPSSQDFWASISSRCNVHPPFHGFPLFQIIPTSHSFFSTEDSPCQKALPKSSDSRSLAKMHRRKGFCESPGKLANNDRLSDSLMVAALIAVERFRGPSIVLTGTGRVGGHWCPASHWKEECIFCSKCTVYLPSPPQALEIYFLL